MAALQAVCIGLALLVFGAGVQQQVRGGAVLQTAALTESEIVAALAAVECPAGSTTLAPEDIGARFCEALPAGWQVLTIAADGRPASACGQAGVVAERGLAALAKGPWVSLGDDDRFQLAGQVAQRVEDGRGLFAISWPLSDGKGRALLVREVNLAVSGVSVPGMLLQGVCIVALVTGMLFLASVLTWGPYFASIERERGENTSEVLKHTQQLVRTRDGIIFALAKLAESRDPQTGYHLERITAYVTILAEAAREHPDFAGEISPGFVRLIGPSSVLHDIGKVGICDAILSKPGPLTEGEYAIMQKHAMIADECLGKIANRVGDSSFLRMAREIAAAHHERWDGRGYPRGLREEQIPLSARITSIADVYDALSARRDYKGAYAHERCVRIIREGRGTRFDPRLVDVFEAIHRKFAEVKDSYAAEEARHAAAEAGQGGQACPAAGREKDERDQAAARTPAGI